MEIEKSDHPFKRKGSSGRIVASALGGMLTSLLMTPLDVIKIRMQSASKGHARGNCFIYCNGLMDHLCSCDSRLNTNNGRIPWYSHHGDFKSFWVRYHSRHNPGGIERCSFHSGMPFYRMSIKFNNGSISSAEALSNIVRTEGFISLWSGLSPTLVMALPQTIIYYSMNDWIKERLAYNKTACNASQSTQQSPLIDFIPPAVGAVSRIFSVFAISPLELMRTKLQSRPMSLKTFLHMLKSTVAHDGVRSLWIGIGPTLLRDVPYSAIFWYFYDYNKSRYLQSIVKRDIHHNYTFTAEFPVSFFFGAMAGFIAGVITHPFDVIKTHRQLELGESIFGNRVYSKSTWKGLQQLYRHRGVQALYSGFTPRLVKTTTASALMVSIFELIKRNLST